MNWFTRGFCNRLLTEENGFCEHLKVGERAPHVMAEHDPWGTESFYMCKACYDEAVEAENNSEVICHDCRKNVLTKDTIEWKWYDFLASQGDQPTVVCTACQSLPKHIARVENDEYERRRDIGDYDDPE